MYIYMYIHVQSPLETPPSPSSPYTQMCEVLGIVETDYFGLKFSDRLAGCEAWINNRVNLKHQLKCSRRPYRLGFRVKFFTDIHLLQQPSTKYVSVTILCISCIYMYTVCTSVFLHLFK